MQDEAARAVLSTWPAKAAETAAWAVQFQAGDLQEQGICLAVSAWTALIRQAFKLGFQFAVDQTRDTVMKKLGGDHCVSTQTKAIDMISLINDPGKTGTIEQAIVHYQSQIDLNATQDGWLAYM